MVGIEKTFVVGLTTIKKRDKTMSYCQIIAFRDGKPAEGVEYGNSWGGAAFIWTSVYDKYLFDPKKEYDSWLYDISRGKTRLWDLAKREDLAMYVRAVHASTFDRAIIRQENFKRYAEGLRKFVDTFHDDKSVCHLKAWADFVEKSDAEAIGFYGTSTSDNLWFEWDEEKEESIPYDLNTENNHFEVYEWLDSLNLSEKKS